MRSSPAQCRAMLTFTLDTTCTVICASQHHSITAIPPALGLCPDPSRSQCPREQRPAAAAGRRAVCRGCLSGQSAVQSVGLVNERCESISLGIAQPFPVLPEERRGRGGSGQMMTLPSLLTFISPCNVLGCLSLFCN